MQNLNIIDKLCGFTLLRQYRKIRFPRPHFVVILLCHHTRDLCDMPEVNALPKSRAMGNIPIEYASRVKIESAKKAFETTRKTITDICMK